MCYKCDTPWTEEEYRHKARKYLMNVTYGMQLHERNAFLEQIAYHDEQIRKALSVPPLLIGKPFRMSRTRLQPLHDMVKNVKRPLVTRLWQAFIRKTVCRKGHHWDGFAIQYCLNCGVFGGLNQVELEKLDGEVRKMWKNFAVINRDPKSVGILHSL